MEALHRQIFESFGRACPTSPCGLYHSHRLVVQNGGGMPEKAPPDEGISTENGRFLAFTRLEEGWSLGFYAENEKQALEMLQLLASIHELVLQNQKLYVVRGNAQDKISLLLNRLFSLNTPDDIAYTAIAALNLGYDMTLPRTICLFTLAAQDDEGAVSEGTLHSVINLIRSQCSIGAQDLVGSINSDQIALCKTLSNPSQPRSIADASPAVFPLRLHSGFAPYRDSGWRRRCHSFHLRLQHAVSGYPPDASLPHTVQLAQNHPFHLRFSN